MNFGVSSCSTLIIPEQIPEVSVADDSSPMTKAGEIYDGDTMLKISHEIQSDHILLLLNHLVVQDGKYELSLSSKDLESLGVKAQEAVLINDYKTIINSDCYEKTD